MAKKFNKQQREILARKLGYDGPMNMFDQFVKSDPAMERKYSTVVEKFMARGGMVKKYQEGGAVTTQQTTQPFKDPYGGYNLDDLYEAYKQDPRNSNEALGYSPNYQMPKEEFKAALDSSSQTYMGQASKNAALQLGQGFKLQRDPFGGFTPEFLRKVAEDVVPGYGPGKAKETMSQEEFNTVFGNPTLRQSILNQAERRTTPEAMHQQYLRDRYYTPEFLKLEKQFADREAQIDNEVNAARSRGASETEIKNLLAKKDTLDQEKANVMSSYNDIVNANIRALRNTAVDYTRQLQNDNEAKLNQLEKTYAANYGEAFLSDPAIRSQYENDVRATKTDLRNKVNTLYSPEFDLQQPEFEALRSRNIDTQMADLEARRATEREQAAAIARLTPEQARQQASGLSTTPMPDMTQMKPIMPNVVGLTGEQAYNSINQTLQNYAQSTGQTIDAVRANPEIQQQVTQAMEANLSARPQTPTVGTTGGTGGTGTTAGTGGAGTTATTTPQIPSTGATGGTGTTATTTPQLPTTGATGTTTGTGTGVTTTGATGTQMANIPTTDTVTRVNIPQVTAATVPTEPGQMVSPTGAPAEAAKIPGAVVSGTAQVTPTTPQAAATMEAATATGAVSGELAGLQPAQGAVSEQAQVQAATMEPTSTALAGMQAAQTTAGQVQGAPTRELVAGELIEGPTVDRAAVESLLAKNEAAQGVVTEDMTVQGQLAKLTSNFEANNPPAWAAGALRNATATLAQRGLAASSLAGQAVIQATIESALPIASADAQIYREMGIQNLTNKQQMAVLSAQQRAAFLGQEFDQSFQTRVTNAATISEIANLNFSAKQQIALENARLTESVNLANLNNRQALVMANAAQIATLETANLNNRQQANVLNAQAFLQMDLTNLSNQQQTALFKSQSMIQSILSDQAAENAAKQFNASSINQVNQFYDGLTAQIKQFNATQTNAMNQFNVSQINSVAEFNASQQNARDQFNAEYRRIIDQSNAEWRRNIALADTAAINRANEVNATAALGISTIEYNNLWQTYRDNIEYAWKTGENALDRENELARQVLQKQGTIEAAKFQVEAAKYQALGGLAAQIFDKGGIAAAAGSTIVGAVTGLAAGVRNAISGGSSSGVNFNKVTGPNAGWTYYSDGKDTIGVDTQGSVYYNNTLVADDQLAYTEYGYSQNDLYGYGEAPDYSATRDEVDSYIFPTD